MDPSPLKILVIDDSEVDASTLGRHLSRIPGLAVDLEHEAEPESALARLADTDIDLVFLDYQMVTASGIEVLQRMRAEGDDRPVIMLTGQGDEYVAARSIREGADEYLVKDDLDALRLAGAITCAREARDRRREERRREESLRELIRENRELLSVSRFDELTGLANRRYFRERLLAEKERSRRHGSKLSLVMIDLDEFKSVNDRFGHAAGDRLLADMGTLLRSLLRRPDLAGRLGGDELCVFLVETDERGAHRLAERICERVREIAIVAPDAGASRVTCSIGVGELEDPTEDVDAFLVRVDAALYAAKFAGRDRTAIASSLVERGHADADGLRGDRAG